MKDKQTIETGFRAISLWSVCTTLFAYFCPAEFHSDLFYVWALCTFVTLVKMVYLYWKGLMNEDQPSTPNGNAA